MYRMYGMPQGAMDGGVAMTGCTDRYLLLQYLHFHHPWWSYATRSHGWRCGYDRMYGMPQGAMDGGVAMTGCTDRYLLLGNSSCVALISYIHVTMQYLHFHHPW